MWCHALQCDVCMVHGEVCGVMHRSVMYTCMMYGEVYGVMHRSVIYV